MEDVGLGDFRFLVAFEAAVVELQGAAVFVDDADDFVGGAGGDVGFDLQGQQYARAGQAGQVCDDLLGDLTGVAPGARRVQLYGAVVAVWLWRRRG